MLLGFLFKQKTAYEMRISDWSSDVCSSDLLTTDGYAKDADGYRSVTGAVSANEATAVGSSNTVTGLRGTAVGASNAASATQSVAVGYNNTAGAAKSIAIGAGASATADRSIVLGLNAMKTGRASVGKECVSPCRFRGSPFH